jgi:midasin
MECAGFDERFLSAISLSSSLSAHLPVGARTILSRSCDVTNHVYLETLSQLSIHPIFSSTILACYEALFPELVARWPTFATTAQIAAGLGRILPVVPYLVDMAEYLLQSQLEEQKFLAVVLGLSDGVTHEEVCSLPTELAVESLLSLHRLLCFRRDTFLPLIDTTNLYPLLHHPHQAVRYVAVRILCIYLKAADAAQEEILEKYGVGKRAEKVLGPWEGRDVDYGFLMWVFLPRDYWYCS